MKLVFASAAAFVAAVLFACSSTDAVSRPTDPNAPVTTCDPALCAAGNTCLELDGDLKCRKACSSNTDPGTSCPANYTCIGANETTDVPAGCTKVADVTQSNTICSAFSAQSGTRLSAYTCNGVTPSHGCIGDGAGNFCCNDNAPETLAAPLCQKNFNPPTTTNAKQWGVGCVPTGGIYGNPACDVDQGFYCFAPGGPADGAAYCTRYNCTSDRECAADYTCQRTNIYPDAYHAALAPESKAGFNKTQTVCVKRDYGALCRADVDCPTIDNQPSHCIQDSKGRGFCTPECSDSANCHHDARCLDPGGGTKVCYPIAQAIVGDAELCSPCISDADCGDDGICLQGDYTQEHFCAKHSATPCGMSNNTCPPPAKGGVSTTCLYFRSDYDPGDLVDYCVGYYSFSATDVFGCYSASR